MPTINDFFKYPLPYGNEQIKENWLQQSSGVVQSGLLDHSTQFLTALQIIYYSQDPKMIVWGKQHHVFFNCAAQQTFGLAAMLQGKKPDADLNPVLVAGLNFLSHVQKNVHLNQITPQSIQIKGKDYKVHYSPVDFEHNGLLACFDTLMLSQNTENDLTSKQRLEVFVETSELGTWELNIITNHMEVSKRYLQIMGFAEDELYNREEFIKRVHPDDLKMRDNALASALKSGIINFRSKFLWRDGSLHWFEAKGKVLYDSAQTPLKMVGTVRDITSEKKHKQCIEENELRLHTTALSSELGTWEYDPLTGTMRWDEASRKLFGVDPETEITTELFMNKIHPDDREAALSKMQDALNPDINSTYDMEYRTVAWPNDEVRWIHAKGKAFFNEHNIPFHFSGTVLDITEKRGALEELKENEQKFRLLANSMTQFVWTSDENGNLNYFNQSVYDYSGLAPEKINAEGWLQIVHPDEQQLNIDKWIESVTTGKDFLFEHRFKRYDGEYRWQLSRAMAQKDAYGKIQMWVGTSTDIHDQKTFARELEHKVEERTNDLQLANKELARKNEELASFAYVSSHDLQEPLRKIQTFAARISEKEILTDAGKDYFARMQNAAQRMQLLIEDLLAYSRTTTGEKVFVKTDLHQILTEVTTDLEQVIKEKKAVIISENLPEINCIPFQFRQLFTNIISNALKFSKAGVDPEIRISSELVNDPLQLSENEIQKQCYQIIISDNGIGFSPEYNSRIFEVFQRLHGKHEYKGTGIGLAICKKIMDNHNGSITAVGNPDVGATFRITITKN